MVEANPFDDANSSRNQGEAEPEDVLLADLIGTKEADLMFEGLVDRNTGIGKTLSKFKNLGNFGGDVTGGDIDDDWYQAEVVGEEAVGGENPTPDQNVTEELLHSMGIDSVDGELLHTTEKLEERDKSRWELDPSSSEDYQEQS
jgi:hypothetical protein